MNTFYTPSGKFDATLTPAALFIIVISSLLLSIVYVALQWFIPFIYLNLFITIGFGIGLAVAGYYAVRFAKIRNPFVALILGVAAGLAGLYSQWALFVSLMSQADGSLAGVWVKTSFNLDTYTAVLFHPSILFEYLPALNEVGTFSIKSAQVTGVFLWLVWFIEAAIIVGCPVFGMWGFGKAPFSEITGKWMDEKKWEGKLVPIDTTMVNKDTFKLSDLKVIDAADNSHDKYHAVVTLHHAEGDPNQYMTVENVAHSVDDKGNAKEDKTEVVTHLLVASSELATAL